MTAYMKKNTQYYLIANKIIYDTHLQLLSDLTFVISTRLLTSASACFICLLEERGRIVSRKILMHAGWEQHGFIVTTNTLNQNILLIRKAIAQITNEPVLKTVFRLGITVPGELSVIPFDNREALDSYISDHCQGKNTIATQEQRFLHSEGGDAETSEPGSEAAGKTSDTSTFSHPPDRPPLLTYHQPSFNNQSHRQLLINIILVPAILLSIFFMAMFNLMNYYSNINTGDDLPLTGYKVTNTNDDVTIYTDVEKCPSDYVSAFLEKHHQDFQDSPAKNLYVSCGKNIHRTSVFLCNKEVKDPTAECLSFYYL